MDALKKDFFFNLLIASHGMWDLSSLKGIKHAPPALEAQGLHHWTTREVLMVWMDHNLFIYLPTGDICIPFVVYYE